MIIRDGHLLSTLVGSPSGGKQNEGGAAAIRQALLTLIKISLIFYTNHHSPLLISHGRTGTKSRPDVGPLQHRANMEQSYVGKDIVGVQMSRNCWSDEMLAHLFYSVEV